MTVSPDYANLVCELLEPLGSIGIRRMFGGAGVYCGDAMFALIAEDSLYFKTDEVNRLRFDEAGCGPFVFTGKNGKQAQMSYYAIPEDLFDDTDALCDWARDALDAALRAKSAKNKTNLTRKSRKS